VLRHRLFTNFNADAEGIDVDQVIAKLLETVPEPNYGEKLPAKPRQAPRAHPTAPSHPAESPPPSLPETWPPSGP
jgi:hypothetical protein